MRVLVMGSGGVGGYFGGLLAQAGEEAGFVARGAQLAAMQEHGLRVHSVHGDFQIPVRARQDPAEFGTADLILFCVKAYDSEQAAGQLRPAIGPETAVLCLQNGVNAVERLEPYFGVGRVLPGTVYIDAAIEAPGLIDQPSSYRRIVFGEPHGPRSARVQRIAATLEHAAIEVDPRDDLNAGLWEKYLHICALSGMTGMTRSAIGPILACPDTRELYEESVRETYAVGRAAGVNLNDEIAEQTIQLAHRMRPDAKSSLLYDLEHGKPLEIEILSGHLVDLGRRLGVPTPVQRVIAAALRLANGEAIGHRQ
ncbi:MAG: ketopantoate reductase family protein [Dehalococcoidia bacterium]